MMRYVAQCTTCQRWLHVINKRYCCGIDYLPKPAFEEPKPEPKPIVIESKPEPIVEEPKIKPKKKRKNNRAPIKLRQQCYERDNYQCVECGSTEELHAHHIIHREHGGPNTLDNLVTLCKYCHANKHKDEPVYRIML